MPNWIAVSNNVTVSVSSVILAILPLIICIPEHKVGQQKRHTQKYAL